MTRKSRTISDAPAQWIAPTKLKPWKDNPRANDGAPVERVVELIKRFGFGAPIVARLANLEIIAGHTRWKAAIQLGLDAHLLALADNRSAEQTPWARSLGDVLAELDAADALMAGWSTAEIEKAIQRASLVSPKSRELGVDEVLAKKPKHICPQCGCEFD